MKNKRLRSKLNFRCLKKLCYFDDEAYDASIVGVTRNKRVVYDYELMVEELMTNEGWSEEDAIEWVEYNTIRGLSYFTYPLKPIIIMMDYEDECYHAENEGDEEDWQTGLKIILKRRDK